MERDERKGGDVYDGRLEYKIKINRERKGCCNIRVLVLSPKQIRSQYRSNGLHHASCTILLSIRLTYISYLLYLFKFLKDSLSYLLFIMGVRVVGSLFTIVKSSVLELIKFLSLEQQTLI